MNISILSNNPEYSFELNSLNALKDGDYSIVLLRRDGKELTSEDWQSIREKQLLATIFFERTKKLNYSLMTKIRISNPPKVEITETHWLPK